MLCQGAPGLPEQREGAPGDLSGEGCLKNCWHFSAVYPTVFADVLLCLSLLKCSTLMTKAHLQGSYHSNVSCNSSAWIMLTSWKCSSPLNALGFNESLRTEDSCYTVVMWKCCSAPWSYKDHPGENIMVLLPVRTPVMVHFVLCFQFVSTIFVLNVYMFFLSLCTLGHTNDAVT